MVTTEGNQKIKKEKPQIQSNRLSNCKTRQHPLNLRKKKYKQLLLLEEQSVAGGTIRCWRNDPLLEERSTSGGQSISGGTILFFRNNPSLENDPLPEERSAARGMIHFWRNNPLLEELSAAGGQSTSGTTIFFFRNNLFQENDQLLEQQSTSGGMIHCWRKDLLLQIHCQTVFFINEVSPYYVISWISSGWSLYGQIVLKVVKARVGDLCTSKSCY